MYCDNCGNQLRDGAKFCNKCGCVVPNDDMNTFAKEATNEPNHAHPTVQPADVGQHKKEKGVVQTESPEKLASAKNSPARKKLIQISVVAVSLVLVIAIVLFVVFMIVGQPQKRQAIFQEYKKIVVGSIDGIKGFQKDSGKNGTAIFDFEGDDTPELFYAEKIEDGYQINYLHRNQDKTENDKLCVVHHFVSFFDESGDTLYCYDIDDNNRYLYECDQSGQIALIDSYNEEKDNKKKESDSGDKISSFKGDKVTIVLNNLSDAEEDELFDEAVDDVSMDCDAAIKYLDTDNSDDNEAQKAEAAEPETEAPTEARKIVDVDSSELPKELNTFIYNFDFGYHSSIEDRNHIEREYDAENLDNIYGDLACLIANHPSCVNMDIYPGEKTFTTWESKADPLQKFENIGTIAFEKNKVLWVMHHIFNISEDTAQKMLQAALEKDEYLYEYEQDGKMYLYNRMGGLGDIGSLITYDTIRFDGEKYYIIYHRTMAMLEYADAGDEETFYIEVAEKEIDGKKYWTIYRHTEDIPEMEEPTTGELSDEAIFSRFTGGYAFTSGVGYWSSHLDLKSDGTFTGDFHDSNMGESGDGYDATEYRSEFSGRFTNPKKINDYTYSFKLAEIKYKNKPGTEEIQEMGSAKLLVKYSEAYGIAGGTETVYAYTADAPAILLPKEFMSWVKNLRGDDRNNAKLMHKCLYAVEPQCGWLGQKEE